MFEAVSSKVKSLFGYNASGYDAVNPSTKRRSSGSTVRSTDNMLSDSSRRQMTESGRDLWRNFPVASWAIRKHVDYVSDFSFQSTTHDEALNQSIENLMRWWSLPGNCDVAGRHPFSRLIRLAEMRRTIDGDVFFMKLANGRLQAIEGDRIRNEGNGKVLLPNGQVRVHGIDLGPGGYNQRYHLYNKTVHGSYDFDRTVPGSNMLMHAYYDSFDQVRGVSPLSSAIASYHDVLEMTEYARLKAKVSQYFALSISRDRPDFSNECDTDGYDLRDFGKGALMLDLDPGDKADFLESKNPSTEFQDFTRLSLQIALKALDIPWSLMDESATNYSSSRIAMLQYIKSCEAKRRDTKLLLDKITYWQVQLWVLNGLLTLPAGMTVRDVQWNWIPAGTPWFDPAKEVKADIELINAGLKTRSEVRLEKYGDDWREVAMKLKEEEDLMEALGLDTGKPEPPPFIQDPTAEEGEEENTDTEDSEEEEEVNDET